MVLSGFFRGYILFFGFLKILDFGKRSLKSLDMKFWFCRFFLEIEVAIKDQWSAKKVKCKDVSKNSISYMVIKDNQEPVRLKFHIGDIVDLNEESKGVAYAKIEFII
ncbi:hypothetical protein RhiirA1_473374 [Rhizophagus irregularis]|uniref:Uncharacterized protein n=1 Tax=Rhizophagus irregularis TaxID=588596 RepID=A0A2N0R0N4_9GLOM|nr:hypothetical protein RhiirA1_473374 [Rhizophagus irregularis]